MRNKGIYTRHNTSVSIKDTTAGITLIALVVSIIVLLILAGISISMLAGDNSLLQRATDAKTNSDNAQIKEKIRLAYNSALTKDIADQKGEVYKSTFEDELKTEFPGKEIDIGESANKKEWVVTIDGVTENVPIGKDTKNKMTVAEAKTSGKVFDGTEDPLVDNYGNEIIVPQGFKIVEGTNATDGIVIQDESAKDNTSKGNQFVWIPVGTIYTNETQTEYKAIVLDRYTFQNNTAAKSGTPTSWSNVASGSGYYQYLASNWIEETTARINVIGKNATAKNLSGFLAGATKGFYIGRYEARVQGYTSISTSNSESAESWTGYTGGTLVEKKDAQVYNYITQNKAAELSRSMYSDLGDFESDLVNSYAWDAATLFLQEFGEENYSVKSSVNNSLENTGTTTDHPCNVYDMASNCCEWTTETYNSSTVSCVDRGGAYSNTSGFTGSRLSGNSTSLANAEYSYRPVLYVK